MKLTRGAVYVSLFSLALAAFAPGCAPPEEAGADDAALGVAREALSINVHREHVRAREWGNQSISLDAV
jgi:hypothetical protein